MAKVTMTPFLRAYLDAILFTEKENLKAATEFSEKALEQAAKDCEQFQSENRNDLANIPDDSAGHDFWLTRNRHGAGFWDRDYLEPIARRLTAASHKFGEIWAYVGDDDYIHFHK